MYFVIQLFYVFVLQKYVFSEGPFLGILSCELYFQNIERNC